MSVFNVGDLVTYKTEPIPAKIISIKKQCNKNEGRYGGRRKIGVTVYTARYEDGREITFSHWEINKSYFKYI